MKISRKQTAINSSDKFEITDNATNDVTKTLSQPGSPLDSSTKEFMESRFRVDFSSVLIHADEKEVRSAESINALAYTPGNDIVFAKNQYSPSTQEGKRLLGHELAHSIQQGNVLINGSSNSYYGSSPIKLQRQPASPQQGWQNCPPDKIGDLNSELAKAIVWVSQAISDLQIQPVPSGTKGSNYALLYGITIWS